MVPRVWALGLLRAAGSNRCASPFHVLVRPWQRLPGAERNPLRPQPAATQAVDDARTSRISRKQINKQGIPQKATANDLIRPVNCTPIVVGASWSDGRTAVANGFLETVAPSSAKRVGLASAILPSHVMCDATRPRSPRPPLLTTAMSWLRGGGPVADRLHFAARGLPSPWAGPAFGRTPHGLPPKRLERCEPRL